MSTAVTPSLSAEELRRWLGEDAPAIERALGAGVVEATPISPFRRLASRRFSFLVLTADGGRRKLRRMATPARAARMARLAAAWEPEDVAAILLRRGALVLEDWIDGTSLAGVRVDAATAEAAGDLLGRLHAAGRIGGRRVRGVRGTAGELMRLGHHLQRLCDGDHLDDAERDALLERAARSIPARADVGIAHGDFCGENLVVDRRGRLRSIDNEDMALRPLDLDLARTLHRWPLDDGAGAAFRLGYTRRRGLADYDAHQEFWTLRVTAWSASNRAQAGDTATAARRVAELREWIARARG